jgi:hypothetical protein
MNVSCVADKENGGTKTSESAISDGCIVFETCGADHLVDLTGVGLIDGSNDKHTGPYASIKFWMYSFGGERGGSPFSGGTEQAIRKMGFVTDFPPCVSSTLKPVPNGVRKKKPFEENTPLRWPSIFCAPTGSGSNVMFAETIRPRGWPVRFWPSGSENPILAML